MKLTRRRVLLALLILVPVVLAGGCILVTRDEAPPDDSDLAVMRSSVKVEENGFRLLAALQAPKPMMHVAEDGVEEELDVGTPFGKDWNPQAAERFLAENPTLLEALDQLLAAAWLQFPRLESFDDSTDYLTRVREVSDAVAYRVCLRQEKGDDRGALQDAVSLVRLGRRVQRAEGVLLACLVGMACESRGLGLARELVQTSRLPDEEIQSFLVALEEGALEDAGLRLALKMEHQLLCKLMDAFGSGEEVPGALDQTTAGKLRALPFPRGLTIQPNKCRRLSAEYFRPLIRYRAPWKDPGQRFSLGGDLPPVQFSWWPSANLLGKVLLSLFLPNNASSLNVLCELHAESASPALLFALRRYRRDQGQLPAKLDDLVPRYLDRVPIDPFELKALRYSRDKSLVYPPRSSSTSDARGCADEDVCAWKIRP